LALRQDRACGLSACGTWQCLEFAETKFQRGGRDPFIGGVYDGGEIEIVVQKQ